MKRSPETICLTKASYVWNGKPLRGMIIVRHQKNAKRCHISWDIHTLDNCYELSNLLGSDQDILRKLFDGISKFLRYSYAEFCSKDAYASGSLNWGRIKNLPIQMKEPVFQFISKWFNDHCQNCISEMEARK